VAPVGFQFGLQDGLGARLEGKGVLPSDLAGDVDAGGIHE
jgi:hypothetical protein